MSAIRLLMRQRVIYTGRVQGVGFRATARVIAQGHPISGYVRNEADGSVLLEAQGEPVNIGLFRQELRTAMHRSIRGEEEAVLPEVLGEQGFVIRS